jgi:hypothetical protein
MLAAAACIIAECSAVCLGVLTVAGADLFRVGFGANYQADTSLGTTARRWPPSGPESLL